MFLRPSAVVLLASTGLLVAKADPIDKISFAIRNNGFSRLLGIGEGSLGIRNGKNSAETFQDALNAFPLGSVVSQGLSQIQTSVRQIIKSETDVMNRVLGRLTVLTQAVSDLADNLFPSEAPSGAPSQVFAEAFGEISSGSVSSENNDVSVEGERRSHMKSFQATANEFTRTANGIFEKTGFKQCSNSDGGCGFGANVLENVELVSSVLLSGSSVDEALVAVTDLVSKFEGGVAALEGGEIRDMLALFKRLDKALGRLTQFLGDVDAASTTATSESEGARTLDEVSEGSDSKGVGIPTDASVTDAETSLAGIFRGVTDFAQIVGLLRRFAGVVVGGLQGPVSPSGTDGSFPSHEAEELYRLMSSFAQGDTFEKDVAIGTAGSRVQVRREDVTTRAPELFVQTYLRLKKALVDFILPPIGSTPAPGSTTAPATTTTAAPGTTTTAAPGSTTTAPVTTTVAATTTTTV